MSVAQVTATNLPMLLHWEDRNSMAFSVEARVPFLDYRVVELCLNLADEEKVGGGISKAVLRRSMRGTVPDLILDRRDKLGFVTAERLWATRDMANRFRSELSEAVRSMPDILSPTIIDRFEEVVAGRRPFDHRYWRAICTARWVNAFKVAL
jgi:asparagine synthase (glutamine-hydrolysing)